METKESFNLIKSGSLCDYAGLSVLVLEKIIQNNIVKFWVLFPDSTTDIVSKDLLVMNQL